MKLIMESWRAYSNKVEKKIQLAEGTRPDDDLIQRVTADIKRRYSEQELHQKFAYEEVEDIVMNAYSDLHPEQEYPGEEQIIAIYRAVGLTKPEEGYDSEYITAPDGAKEKKDSEMNTQSSPETLMQNLKDAMYEYLEVKYRSENQRVDSEFFVDLVLPKERAARALAMEVRDAGIMDDRELKKLESDIEREVELDKISDSAAW